MDIITNYFIRRNTSGFVPLGDRKRRPLARRAERHNAFDTLGRQAARMRGEPGTVDAAVRAQRCQACAPKSPHRGVFNHGEMLQNRFSSWRPLGKDARPMVVNNFLRRAGALLGPAFHIALKAGRAVFAGEVDASLPRAFVAAEPRVLAHAPERV